MKLVDDIRKDTPLVIGIPGIDGLHPIAHACTLNGDRGFAWAGEAGLKVMQPSAEAHVCWGRRPVKARGA